MFELKKQIFEIIASSIKNPIDRRKWLMAEVAELGLRHNGLDDLPPNAVLVLAALFANGVLDYSKISKLTDVTPYSLGDSTDLLNEYDLVIKCPNSGEYQLTDKGESACRDIFNNIVIRNRFELRRDLEHIETIYSKVSEL